MTHNKVPWTNELTPLIRASDKRVIINGRSSQVDFRLLAEGNFQFAKERVNGYDEVLNLLKWALPYLEDGMTGDGRMLFDRNVNRIKEIIK